MSNSLLKSGVLVAITVLASSAFLSSCTFESNRGEANQTLTPAEIARTEGGELLGVFQGRVPCTSTNLEALPMPLPTPESDDCQRVKMKLDLYNNASGSPTTYILFRIYVGQGNEVITTAGRWTISRGTFADPDALVYNLDSETPAQFQSYFVADDNILLLLDQEGRLMVGNASESFTLSRTN